MAASGRKSVTRQMLVGIAFNISVDVATIMDRKVETPSGIGHERIKIGCTRRDSRLLFVLNSNVTDW